jgi:hypothetical protein
MKLTGEDRNTWGKTRPSATLSTTNPTWTDPGLNPCLRGGRPAESWHNLKIISYTKQKIVYEHFFAISYLCD